MIQHKKKNQGSPKEVLYEKPVINTKNNVTNKS